jgi:cell division protein FtsB
MAAARPAHEPRRAPRGAPKARPRAVTRGRAGGASTGIRWDRVSRVALLLLFAGVLALYVGPARSYWGTLKEAKQRRAEVRTLERENGRLRARRAALNDSRALELAARRLGMVRQGERAYVVKGLPKGG